MKRLSLKSLLNFSIVYGFFSLVMWPAYANASESLLVTNQPVISLSQAVSVFRNSGEPVTLKTLLSQQQAGLFTPVGKNTTNFGLTQDEIWLKALLSTSASTPQRWFLEIKQPSLDVIEFYYANQQDMQFNAQLSGDFIAFKDKPFPHHTPIFELQLQPNQHYVFYLKVQSQGTVTVPLKLWQPDALWQSDQKNMPF